MNKIKFIINNFGIIFGVLALVSLVAYADVWVPPTAIPPGNNTAAPINVSANNQVKIGGLGVGPLAVFGDALVSGVYKQGGVAGIKTGISLNCAAGQTIGAPIISGGIVTGGSCGAGGGGGASGAPTLYSTAANAVTVVANCPAGQSVYSGGCYAATINCDLNSSAPYGNGWFCGWRGHSSGSCPAGANTAYVLCR